MSGPSWRQALRVSCGEDPRRAVRLLPIGNEAAGGWLGDDALGPAMPIGSWTVR